ncbi:MAG: hypothetical protein RI564_08240 [Gracilimonas sp.]|jgi:uncharacterized membrane protein YjfL (UPF0719 family)|nr:hypothetical protein [Gracilimonas sp.]
MAWLKDALLDIIILLFILSYVISANSIIQIVLWVYTALLLLSKILAFFMPSLQQRANKTEVPPYFYHVVYALTVGLFIFGSYYYFAGVWSLIWLASIYQYATSNKK